MKRLLVRLAVLFVVASTAVVASAIPHQTVLGWVADSQCGAKGAAAGQEACTKKCLEKGAELVIVTDADQKVLTVLNPEALKGYGGKHVKVVTSPLTSLIIRFTWTLW